MINLLVWNIYLWHSDMCCLCTWAISGKKKPARVPAGFQIFSSGVPGFQILLLVHSNTLNAMFGKGLGFYCIWRQLFIPKCQAEQITWLQPAATAIPAFLCHTRMCSRAFVPCVKRWGCIATVEGKSRSAALNPDRFCLRERKLPPESRLVD